MAQRPGFPIKLDQKTKSSPAKVQVTQTAPLHPQGLGLDSSAVRQRMVQKLAAQGLKAALLSQIATEVYSIERLKGLHEKARANLRHFRLANVHLLFGDGMLGYPQGAPYAAIISAAGGENLPQAWLDQLAMGGRLVAPTVTTHGQQALMVVDKTPEGLKQTVLEAVHFVPLKSGIS